MALMLSFHCQVMVPGDDESPGTLNKPALFAVTVDLFCCINITISLKERATPRAANSDSLSVVLPLISNQGTMSKTNTPHGLLPIRIAPATFISHRTPYNVDRPFRPESFRRAEINQ